MISEGSNSKRPATSFTKATARWFCVIFDLMNLKKIFSKTKTLQGVIAILLIVIFLGSSLFIFDEIREGDFLTWLGKESSPTHLKIGFTNDWEYGPRKRLKHKLTGQAPTELRKAVDFFNNEYKPDLVIGGGDYIESSSIKKEDAKRQLTEINALFKILEAPRLYALGNHDMRSLTKSEVREILEMPANHAIQDIGDWRIIVLDTNFNKEDDTDRADKNYVLGYVSKAELEWLKSALDTERPVIVFSHHSPISPPRPGAPSLFVLNIINEAEVREVLEEKGNVVAVVSGHDPQSYYEERNGIHYFIVDTMVNEAALGSFATIDLEYVKSERYAEVTLNQKGIRPASYSVDWHYGEKEKDDLPEITPKGPTESEEVMEKLEE